MSGLAEVRDAAAAALGVEINSLRPVAGGDLNEAYAAELADGHRVFVKTSPDAAPGGYAAEAAGLRWIAAAEGAPPVPEVLAVAEDEAPRLLVLEWISTDGSGGSGGGSGGSAGSGGSGGSTGLGGSGGSAGLGDPVEVFGRELAALHRAGAPAYGAPAPGAPDGMRLGPLVLPAGTAPSWAEAYAELRLRPLARRASERGALSAEGVAAVERVCARMPELAGPSEPPARLHGDLWGGNVLPGPGGRLHLIDPAAHGGHREVDLAMLRLFGGPGERVFSAYDEVFPLADGHAERVELWQLLPLLVHAVLFGGGYGSRAAAVARRYAG